VGQNKTKHQTNVHINAGLWPIVNVLLLVDSVNTCIYITSTLYMLR